MLWDGRSYKWLRDCKTPPGRPGDLEDTDPQGPVWSAYFSPDDESIVAASKDGKVRVFDVRSGRCRETLNDHTDAVMHAMYDPQDGNRVLSCSMDKTARLWDLRQDHGSPS
eukprot:UN3120